MGARNPVGSKIKKTPGKKSQAQAKPASNPTSAIDLMIQRLERLRQRVQKEWRDAEDVMAFSEAIRIVRTYFGK